VGRVVKAGKVEEEVARLALKGTPGVFTGAFGATDLLRDISKVCKR
jgi:hypothetical protein